MAAAKKPTRKKVPPPPPPRPEEVAPERVVPLGEKLPIAGDPPYQLREGEGMAELARLYPTYELTIDAGVFMWLWRFAEARAIVHYNNPYHRSAMADQVDVSLRAALAFRTAAGTVHERLNNIGGETKKVWVRKEPVAKKKK